MPSRRTCKFGKRDHYVGGVDDDVTDFVDGKSGGIVCVDKLRCHALLKWDERLGRHVDIVDVS